MRENNLYPFGGDPVRKLNRNPGTGKGMKTGMGMRMYATGERNKLRADALTSRRTVFPIAHVRTQLPPSPETFDSTSLFPPAPFPRNFPPLSPRSLTLSSRRDEHGNRLNNALLFNSLSVSYSAHHEFDSSRVLTRHMLLKSRIVPRLASERCLA